MCAVGGDRLTLLGSNFGERELTVTLQGVECVVVFHNDTRVEFISVPGNGVLLPVRAVVSTQPSNTASFSYDQPFVAAIEPLTADTDGGRAGWTEEIVI